jgi:hypothetical protein
MPINSFSEDYTIVIKVNENYLISIFWGEM